MREVYRSATYRSYDVVRCFGRSNRDGTYRRFEVDEDGATIRETDVAADEMDAELVAAMDAVAGEGAYASTVLLGKL